MNLFFFCPSQGTFFFLPETIQIFSIVPVNKHWKTLPSYVLKTKANFSSSSKDFFLIKLVKNNQQSFLELFRATVPAF